MKITMKESSIVLPSEHIPKGRICLSNLDLIYPPFYSLAVYVYKSDSSPKFFGTEILKESLSKVLVTFYPLAGRLALDEIGRPEINCNGEGVRFLEAETDCPLGDYADINANIFKLFPAVGFGRQIFSSPLLLLQVTRFCCGGVLLGVMVHHYAVDGGGGTHFVNAWSELARGQLIAVQPVFDTSFLRARVPPTPKFHHVEYDPPPFATRIENDPESFTSLIMLPTDLVNVLKSKVNNETVRYTTFEVLTAHLWRCSTITRNFNPNQANALIIPVDGGYRLSPDLPKGYSGNVISYATTTMSTTELLSEPLVKIVERISKTTKMINGDYLRSAIDYLEKNIHTDELVKYQGIQQLIWHSFFVNTWVKLPIFDADFGGGRHSTMLPPGLLEGMAIFLPCLNGENGVPFVINLQKVHRKSFDALLSVLE